MIEVKGVQKKTPFQIFVLLISQLLFIGSLKFLCLPHIIRGYILTNSTVQKISMRHYNRALLSTRVGTRILKIR